MCSCSKISSSGRRSKAHPQQICCAWGRALDSSRRPHQWHFASGGFPACAPSDASVLARRAFRVRSRCSGVTGASSLGSSSAALRENRFSASKTGVPLGHRQQHGGKPLGFVQLNWSRPSNLCRRVLLLMQHTGHTRGFSRRLGCRCRSGLCLPHFALFVVRRICKQSMVVLYSVVDLLST